MFFFAEEGVAGTPRLDAIVVGVGTVVLDENVLRGDPVVQNPDEQAVAAVGDVVAAELVVVGTAFHEYAGRIAGMHFAGGDAQPVRQVVVEDPIMRGRGHFQANVGAVREVVSGDEVFRTVIQIEAVPDPIGMVIANNAVVNFRQDQAALARSV